jgi:hypothetical protein
VAKLKTRFEIKYRISEEHAASVSAWLKNFMEPDENAEEGGAAYDVHSLYLDSEDWSIYRDTRNGLFRRFKLRARTYAFTPDAPVFLEVKSRAGEAMWKSRALVPRQEAIRILAGEPALNLPSTPALEEFLMQRDLRSAVPKCWVTYQREAWVGKDRESLVRVTFDSKIRCGEPTADLSEPPCWYDLPEVKQLVILELKYTHSYPPWIAELVRAFDLERKAMSKYRHSVEVIRMESAERNGLKVAEPKAFEASL